MTDVAFTRIIIKHSQPETSYIVRVMPWLHAPISSSEVSSDVAEPSDI